MEDPFVMRPCQCARWIFLVFEDGEAVEWIVSPFRTQDFMTAEEEAERDRIKRTVHEAMDEHQRQEWEAIVSAEAERAAEMTEDQTAVGRLTFTPTTICECGRRYRALDDYPWIELLEAGEGKG